MTDAEFFEKLEKIGFDREQFKYSLEFDDNVWFYIKDDWEMSSEYKDLSWHFSLYYKGGVVIRKTIRVSAHTDDLYDKMYSNIDKRMTEDGEKGKELFNKL